MRFEKKNDSVRMLAPLMVVIKLTAHHLQRKRLLNAFCGF